MKLPQQMNLNFAEDALVESPLHANKLQKTRRETNCPCANVTGLSRKINPPEVSAYTFLRTNFIDFIYIYVVEFQFHLLWPHLAKNTPTKTWLWNSNFMTGSRSRFQAQGSDSGFWSREPRHFQKFYPGWPATLVWFFGHFVPSDWRVL